MNALDLSQEMSVRPFGFNVPCRQFVIEAQVTRDKRMPMVDEFALRVLRTCGVISISRLTAFFGFSKIEMEIVLADLQARSLVILNADDVSLHPSANEMFRTVGSGPPTIIEVEGWVNRLWFDLVSRSMIAAPNLRNVRNLIELKQSPSTPAIAEDFARDAFQTNFREYLLTVRRIRNPESLSLYAVTSVQAARYSYAQITGGQVLRYDPTPRIESALDLADTDTPQRVRQLTDAMTQALDLCHDPEPSVNAQEEYERLVGSNLLTLSRSEGTFLDVRRWLELQSKRDTSGGQAFLGTSYLETNRNAFSQMLERALDARQFEGESVVDVVWFRPGGSLWGTSEALRDSISDIRAAIRRHSNGSARFQTTLVVPASITRDQRKWFGALFERGVAAQAGLLSPAIEVLLVRGIGAAVSVLAPLSKSTNVWLGEMTIRDADIDRIEKRLQWFEQSGIARTIWSPATRSSNAKAESVDGAV